jgi:molybdate transport system ATP-binding protein
VDEPPLARLQRRAEPDVKLEVAIRRQLGATALNVEFSAEAPVVGLFGRSGSGKSSVVNAIAGLLTPASGRIAIDGEVLFDAARGINLPPEKRRIGYVFQDALLFPHLSVKKNLLYGAARATGGISFDAVVGLLGIEALLERSPTALSGGEKQRVAIGRALLSQPRLLLMDEPLAALDNPRRQEVLRHVEALRNELHQPVVYVSHAVSEITRLADHVVLMNEGGVLAHGSVHEIFNRADLRPYTGRYEGGALIEAEAVGHDAAFFLTRFRFSGGDLVAPGVDTPVGTRVRIRIRSRDVSLATERPAGISIRNVLEGDVTSVSDTGGAIVEASVRLGRVDVPARISRQALVELGIVPGRRVFVLVKAIAFDKRSVGFTA